MIATLITATICIAAWFLTGDIRQRWYGALSGLSCAALWIAAGIAAGTWLVVLVALFCAACCTRLLFKGLLSVISVRRSHVN